MANKSNKPQTLLLNHLLNAMTYDIVQEAHLVKKVIEFKPLSDVHQSKALMVKGRG